MSKEITLGVSISVPFMVASFARTPTNAHNINEFPLRCSFSGAPVIGVVEQNDELRKAIPDSARRSFTRPQELADRERFDEALTLLIASAPQFLQAHLYEEKSV